MDLSLNFAPLPSSTGGGTAPAAGRSAVKTKSGRWTDRMKASQQLRRVQRKQQQKQKQKQSPPTGSQQQQIQIQPHQKPTPNTLSSQPVASTSKAVLPAANSAAKSAKKAGARQEPSRPRKLGKASIREDTSDALTSSGPPGSRQVISSLFSNIEKRQNTDGSTDANGEPLAFDVHAIEPEQSELTPSNAPSLADDFAALPLSPSLVSHVKGKMALAHPTMVQKLAVPFLCNPATKRKDVLLQAQTGSGKTLSYLLPIIQDLCQLPSQLATPGKQLDRSLGTLAIVLVPTRELANQIFEVATKLLAFQSSESAGHRWITPGLLTGGAHRQHEKARLRKGISLLIATPGRLLDHLETTKAFRIAGETKWVQKQNTSGSKMKAAEDDDEFAYEDSAAMATAGPPIEDDGGISSDEDFENMPASRSHRTLAAAKGFKSQVVPEDPQLALRWLVLDEADRLMDMGFEPQISSIVKILSTRLQMRKEVLERANNRGNVVNRLGSKAFQRRTVAERRTVLCSATVEEKVQTLAGIALKEPMFIKGDISSGDTDTRAPDNVQSKANYAPPSQLVQRYCVVPAKLRFVTLVALLRQVILAKFAKNHQQRILVFMSCTDAVDFAWTAMGGFHMKRDEDAAEKAHPGLAQSSELLPGASIYRLHGNLDLQTRLTSLKQFSSGTSGPSILLCTSVAARGLDIDDVTCVVQYDLPTEGGLHEYIHRVGRTARAGMQGQSWAFLLPSETSWVQWATEGTSRETGKSGWSLKEESVDRLLQAGFGGGSPVVYETRATDVQMAFERWVVADEANARLARKAFSSHVRAYATHPSNEKHIFHVKNLHLGHLAKAFGLREAPAGIGGGAGGKKDKMQLDKAASKGGKKRKAADAAVGSDDDVSEKIVKVGKKPAIPRSGRALEGKGLHGPRNISRGDFNIANTAALEAMVHRRA